jgi:hypothetical protein
MQSQFCEYLYNTFPEINVYFCQGKELTPQGLNRFPIDILA